VKYKATKTTCACGKPRRPSPARNCYDCHWAAQRKYRDELKRMQTGSTVYVDAVRAFKRRLLLDAVKAENGNMCRASIRLGVCRSTMTRAMREVGLSASQVKEYLRDRKCATKEKELSL